MLVSFVAASPLTWVGVAHGFQKAGGQNPSPSASSPAPGSPQATADNARNVEAAKKTLASGSYDKKWAIVIGINYTQAERGGKGDIPALRRAENDAMEVAKLLREKYGFSGMGDMDRLEPLIGKEATRANIVTQLEKALTQSLEKVKENDCVLVYFSGHGDLYQQNDQSQGYLLPIDAKLDPQAALLTGTGYAMRDLVDLLHRSRARHKLLILDCCYSSKVFAVEDGRPGGRFDWQDTKQDVFQTPAIQAISASRSAASDGKGEERNSPFTTQVLRILKTMPRRLPLERRFFTTSQLFKPIRELMESLEQSPQCRWLDDRMAGEFHFYPDENAKFDDEPEIDDQDREMILAMVSSSFGNWWGDEMPWFIPALRSQILGRTATKKATTGMIDPHELLDAARNLINRQIASGATHDENNESLSDADRARLAHLNLMLNFEHERQREKVIQSVLNDDKQGLVKLTKSKAAKAADFHYLAVLLQKLDQKADARKAYETALERYEKEALSSAESKTLRVLCLLDLGMLEMSANNYENAIRRFSDAQNVFLVWTPPQFTAFCLSQQSDALRNDGLFLPADVRMGQAIKALTACDPNQESLLTSAAYNHDAWACMETWRFAKATARFKKTIELLKKQNRDTHPESLVDLFHALHGLALVKRYQGNDAEALSDYRELTSEIRRAIRWLENPSDQRHEPEDLEGRGLVHNYSEIRALLYERLVNSLERQADCSFFGRAPDYAEAADDYRRALQEVNLLPADKKGYWRQRLGYRRVVALCLQQVKEATEQTDEARRNSSGSRGSEGARRPVDIAREILEKLVSEAGQEADRANQLYAALARVCLDLAEHSLPSKVAQRSPEKCAGPLGDREQNVKDLLKILLDQTYALKSRDEVEQLMFAYRLAMTHNFGYSGDARKDLSLSIDYADHLLWWCRQALKLSQSDLDATDLFRKGLLNYLRPSYDCGFLAKAAAQPGQVKELIEIAYEATTGNPFDKAAQHCRIAENGHETHHSTSHAASSEAVCQDAFLAMLYVDRRCYFMLDSRRGKSCVIAVDRHLTDLLKAAGREDWALACPEELQRAILALDIPDNQAIRVLWRDPLWTIYHRGAQGPGLAAKNHFPFDLGYKTSEHVESTPITAAQPR
jgi:tetratricopeptide (TPR) repeat protein